MCDDCGCRTFLIQGLFIMSVKKSCCFFGHRKIDYTKELENQIYETAEKLILNENVDTFYFGSKSEFNSLCHKAVTELKEKHPEIKRIYIRAEYPYIDDSYKKYLLKDYEGTYFPEKMINAGRTRYVERNREMIDKSDFCIVYYRTEYKPPMRRKSKRDLTEYQSRSGTKTAYDYAKKKGKTIINL